MGAARLDSVLNLIFYTEAALKENEFEIENKVPPAVPRDTLASRPVSMLKPAEVSSPRPSSGNGLWLELIPMGQFYFEN